MKKNTAIHYELLESRPSLLWGTLLLVGIQLSFFSIFGSGEWWGKVFQSPLHFFQLMLWERFLIEMVAVFIICRLLTEVGVRWNPSFSVQGAAPFWYFLRFLPALFLAFLIYGPLTMGLRYLSRHYDQLQFSDFLENYLLQPGVYFGYLLPTLIFGYFLLLFNLYKNRQSQSVLPPAVAPSSPILSLTSNYHPIQIEVATIWWISKKDRKVFIKTAEATIPVSTTLKALENQIPSSDFFRVNRSTIVARQMILDYSFWENDKYVLRMKDAKETAFVMSRERMRVLREGVRAD